MATTSELKVLITARDEATRAFKSTSAALQKLGVDQEKATSATKAAWTQGYEAKWLGNAEKSLKSLGLTSAQARAQLKAAGVDVTKLGQSAETSAGGLSKLSGALGISATAIAATAVAAAGAAFVAVGTKSLTMAAAVEESDNLFRVAMGNMTNSGTAFSETMERRLGLVASDVRKDMGIWQAMFRGMGMGEETALKLSNNLTRLTADMGSFYNLPHDLMWEKIRAGIVGETEPLRQLGILVDENTVKQFALRTGLIAAGTEMNAQQKVLARYGSILEQTQMAQGDLERTMGSTTNQWRLWENNVKRAEIALGEKLLPTANATLTALNRLFASEVTPSITKQAGAVDELARSYAGLQRNTESLAAYQARAREEYTKANTPIPPPLSDAAKGFSSPFGGMTTNTSSFIELLGAYRQVTTAQEIATAGLQAYSAAAMGLDQFLPGTMSGVAGLGNYASATAADMAALAAQTAAVTVQLAAMNGAFADASLRLDPGARATSARVKALEEAISAAQETSAGGGASAGARAATKAATAAVKDQQEALQGLNDELSTTRNRLQELQNVQLKGMGAMDAQTRALDKQSKQLRLQQLALYASGTNRKGELKGGALKQYNALQLQMDAIARKSETIELKKSLAYDDKLAKIKEAATGGPPKEMEYTAALKEAKDQWAQYQKLNKSIEAQEKSLKSAQDALEATQAAMEAVTGAGTAINENLKKLQKELEKAKDDEKALAQAFKDATAANGADAAEMAKLGPRVASLVKERKAQAEAEMAQLAMFSAGIITAENKNLDALQKKYRDFYDQNLLDAQRAAQNLPSNPDSSAGPSYRIPTTGIGSGRARASGGPVRAGHLYLVGERGPEPFVPKVDGTILPNSSLRSAGGGASGGSGGVTIQINLGGVTVTGSGDEDRLAAKVGDEVIRAWRQVSAQGARFPLGLQRSV